MAPETTGIAAFEHGSIVRYEEPATGAATIRRTDRGDLMYGVVDATGAAIDPAFRLRQEQTRQ